MLNLTCNKINFSPIKNNKAWKHTVMASMWLNRHFHTLHKLVQAVEAGNIYQNYKGILHLLTQQSQEFFYRWTCIMCKMTYEHGWWLEFTRGELVSVHAREEIIQGLEYERWRSFGIILKRLLTHGKIL